ncbi:MAG: response regulator [Dehalococcoidia bacterium]
MQDGHKGRIRVLLADDHQLLRQAMQVMLEMQGPIEVVAEARDGHEAIGLTDQFKPDVVLMDLAMPGLNGVEATSQIVRRNPRTKVLIVTGYVDDRRVPAALRAGAHGYVVKRSNINELLVAIQTVSLGNPYFGQSLAHGRTPVEYLLQTREEGPADTLSSREREVLQFVAAGYPNQEIADRLVVSVRTVEAHKAHIMAKLKAQNRTDLITYAIRQGITNIGDDEPQHSH